MSLRIDRVVTSGVFSLDGDDFDVDNNVYVVGTDTEVVVIDAAHDHIPIVEAIDRRSVRAIVCTHAHNDHIAAAADLADATDAQIWLHPADRMLWDMTHPERAPAGELAGGQTIPVAGTDLTVLHTPGHTPGSVCLHLREGQVVFTGDTLFPGGPGATGRSFSHRPTLIDSIVAKLLTLDEATRVLPGHGDETTIGIEAASLPDWRAQS